MQKSPLDFFRRYKISLIGLLLTVALLSAWFFFASVLLRQTWTCGAKIYGPKHPVWDGLIGCISANELADILAGFFAPAAFVVLIIALMLQGLELQAQREELKKTRAEFAQSREVAEAQLELIENQNAIAMRTARANYELSLFDRRLEVYISVRNTLLAAERYDAIYDLNSALIKAKPLFPTVAIEWLQGLASDAARYRAWANTDKSFHRQNISDAEHRKQQEAVKHMIELEEKFEHMALRGPLDEYLGVSLTMPEALFPPMVDSPEDRQDIEAAREILARIKDGTEELIPSEFVHRIVDGENTVKVWREFRGMTADELADKAGIGNKELSEIENGECDGSFTSIKKIAAALNITVDDL